MALDPDALGPVVLAFLGEHHLATLTTLRADGSPHVVPVGFTYDPDERLVRIIARSGSQKVANARRGGRAAVSQVDGARWLTLEGTASVTDDPARIAEAVRRYAQRYREPSESPTRVAIELHVDRILGRG